MPDRGPAQRAREKKLQCHQRGTAKECEDRHGGQRHQERRGIRRRDGKRGGGGRRAAAYRTQGRDGYPRHGRAIRSRRSSHGMRKCRIVAAECRRRGKAQRDAGELVVELFMGQLNPTAVRIGQAHMRLGHRFQHAEMNEIQIDDHRKAQTGKPVGFAFPDGALQSEMPRGHDHVGGVHAVPRHAGRLADPLQRDLTPMMGQDQPEGSNAAFRCLELIPDCWMAPPAVFRQSDDSLDVGGKTTVPIAGE